MAPKAKYRAYDQWAVTPVEEYRGLSDQEKDWLSKFNVEYMNANRVEQPILNDEQRRETYRRRYHRRLDGMVQARYEQPREGYDPTVNIEKLIDRHNRLQRILINTKKK